MMISYFAIGLGGALGAVSRSLLARIFPQTLFEIPISILLINIIGCLILGVITELFTHFSPENQYIKLFLTTGFLGGFTTFSTFSLETNLLFEKNLYSCASIYIFLSVSLCLFSFFCGLRIIRFIFLYGN